MLYDFPLVRELSLPHLKYVSSGRNYTGVILSDLYHNYGLCSHSMLDSWKAQRIPI